MTAPAGWHPDPENAGLLRYWDGAAWTEHRAPLTAPPSQQVAHQQQVSEGVEIFGIAAAILFPIAGFLVGLFLIGKSRMAGLCLGLSVIAAIVWYFLLAQAYNSTSF